MDFARVLGGDGRAPAAAPAPAPKREPRQPRVRQPRVDPLPPVPKVFLPGQSPGNLDLRTADQRKALPALANSRTQTIKQFRDKNVAIALVPAAPSRGQFFDMVYSQVRSTKILARVYKRSERQVRRYVCAIARCFLWLQLQLLTLLVALFTLIKVASFIDHRSHDETQHFIAMESDDPPQSWHVLVQLREISWRLRPGGRTFRLPIYVPRVVVATSRAEDLQMGLTMHPWVKPAQDRTTRPRRKP